MGGRPLGRLPAGGPCPARAWPGPLRHHHPGLVPGAGQALVPVPPGYGLCLLDDFRWGASTFTVLLLPLRAPPKCGRRHRHNPTGARGLHGLAAGPGLFGTTWALSLSMLRVFFDACHRHGWLPGLAPNATIYVEELPFHHDEIARFVPEFVMAQLESDAALAKIPHRTTRNLVVVLIETGLRGGDACNLAFSSVFQDSTGWPCLRFEATKVRAEQLVPLSAKAAAAIADQQAYVRQHWPGGSPWLFPGLAQRRRVQALFAFRLHPSARRLGKGDRPRDQAGQPVRVTGHQFRHTLGTRLINSGVPSTSCRNCSATPVPNMTGHYAKVHDATVREAFDRYQSQRVDIVGERVGYNPDSPTASAEWVKQNLNRVRDSLPNGYCARPAQQECPHPSACLTCRFQTTPSS